MHDLSSHNHYVPPAIVTFLILVVFSALASDYWQKSPTSFTVFRTGLELFLLASSVPVWLIGGCNLWTNGEVSALLNDRWVVLFTPICALLLVVASSNPTRILGVATVSLGAWLMSCKLTLKRDITCTQ